MLTEGGSKCVEPPSSAQLPEFILPFDGDTEVVCTHSSGIGSHAWANAYFALDLASDYLGPPATVRAAAAGVAFVFQGEDGRPCTEPPGTPARSEPSNCGDGWGNRVKVHHGSGVVSYYVHLDRVLVRTGQHVAQGEPLGVEGRTGAAGHRHLHFSVQQIPGVSADEWLRNIAWSGASIPFKFDAVVDGVAKTVDAATFVCPHAQAGTRRGQPRLQGGAPTAR
jgi:murein DD-endopeptidase MepM/ murein hydrolase activator NlpD